MRPWLALCASVLLIAGCSSPTVAPGESSADDAVEPDQPRATSSGVPSQAVRVLDHKDSYALNHPMAATTMTVAGNLSALRAQLTSSSVGPCGTVVGEPEDPLGPRVVFTAPSGDSTSLDASMQQCRVSVLSGPATITTADFAAEPGEWQVTFYGRSLGVEVHLLVDGT